MLWTKVNMLLVSGLCALSQVSGAANVAQQIDYMDTMTKKIGAARDSLNSYSGGIPSSLGVARSIMVAQTSTREARMKLADEDRMTAEEGDQYYDSYSRMVPVLLDAIHSAKDKAPLFKKAGLGPEARTYLGNLHNEKRLFESEAKNKLPDETFRKSQPSIEQISTAFDEADRALQ